MTEESRQTPRRRTLKGARIVLNDGFSTFTCTIRNMSDSGAKLAMASILGVPQRFFLILDDGRRFECEVAWRTETEIGVHFV